jgi:two-component system sensor kinase FixL
MTQRPEGDPHECESPCPPQAESPGRHRVPRAVNATEQQTLDAIPSLIWICDDRGQGLWSNRAWEAFTGTCLRSDSPNVDWSARLDAADRSIVVDRIRAVIDSGVEASLDMGLVHRDGGTRRIVGLATPWDAGDGAETHCLCVCCEGLPLPDGGMTIPQGLPPLPASGPDLPSRAERWFEYLLESAPDAIVIVDERGKILLANRRTEQIFGYEPRDLTGASVEKLVPLRFRDLHRKHRQEYTAQPRIRPMTSALELHALRSDGSEFPVEISLSPIETPEGLIVACAVRDVTQRVRAQRLLKQRQDELAHVMRLTTAGEMATGLAHELNQPLYSIANYARGCVHRLESSSLSESEMRDVAEEIAKEAARAAEIIRRLRQMVQKCESVPAAIDLNRTVREACALYQADLKRAATRLEMHLEDSLSPVRADEVQLQQVVINLLKNAVEAMRDTPLAERVVQVATGYDESQYAYVRVSDAGCGIAAEDLERVFDAFHTTSAQGMGMGLAISRTIIQSLGGRIWASNNAESGATFLLTIPLTSNEDHGS